MSRLKITLLSQFVLIAFFSLSTSVFAQSGLQRKNRQQSLSQIQNSFSPISDNHFIATWVSDNFSINQGGSWINWGEGSTPESNFNWFWFSYNQQLPDRGFDVGVGRLNDNAIMVADLATENYNGWQAPGYNRTLDFEYVDNLDPSNVGAFWWMGPKTIIYSYPTWTDKPVPDADRLGGEFECYIINNASLPRDELANRLGLQYQFGRAYDNGDFYHHYTNTRVFQGTDGQPKTIFQVWTVKDNFTNVDSVPVNQIQGHWMTEGLVPWYFYNQGWKINLETAGQFGSGNGLFLNLALPSND